MITQQYGIKLIYLPDLSHPMALRASTGLFGASSMKPTLQDGWMLTALDATSDSKTAETITAVASLVSAVGGLGGGSAAAGGAKAATSRTLALDGSELPPVLPPGLYELVYDSHTGKLSDIRPVRNFCASGICGGAMLAPANARVPSDWQQPGSEDWQNGDVGDLGEPGQGGAGCAHNPKRCCDTDDKTGKCNRWVTGCQSCP
jgi:hypothetical protein